MRGRVNSDVNFYQEFSSELSEIGDEVLWESSNSMEAAGILNESTNDDVSWQFS